MSDSYAWFGCAYFIYDMWTMYEVYVQKIADKLKIIKDDTINENVSILKDDSNRLLYDKLNISSGADDGYHSNGSHDGKLTQQQKKDMERHYFVKRLAKIPTETPSFLAYCLDNPVMTIHHVFLASFGLLVIVVWIYYFKENTISILTCYFFLLIVFTWKFW